MSISTVFSDITPHERAIYPDGVNVILALLGLGGNAKVNALAVKMFDSEKLMLNLIRKVSDLDASPEIKSETALFFTIHQHLIRSSYLKKVEEYVSIARLDFGSSEAIRDLNQWVQDRTGFSDVFKPEALQEAFVVMINTLWFKDSWVIPFPASDTLNRRFTKRDGQVVSLPMMRNSSRDIEFFRERHLTGVVLPFKGGARAEFMMGLSPRSAFDDEFLFRNPKNEKVIVFLPKFSHQSEIDLKPLVEAAGLSSFLKPGAMDGIVDDPHASVSDIKQIIFADFNEEGAEVRAVTYAAVTRCAIPEGPPPVVIEFNQPFHYRIRKAGVTLLEGFFEAKAF